MRDNLDWRPAGTDSELVAQGFIQGFGQFAETDSAGSIFMGTFYSANAAQQNDLCPDGWRLPDTAETRTLLNSLGTGDARVAAQSLLRPNAPASLFHAIALHWSFGDKTSDTLTDAAHGEYIVQALTSNGTVCSMNADAMVRFVRDQATFSWQDSITLLWMQEGSLLQHNFLALDFQEPRISYYMHWFTASYAQVRCFRERAP